MCKFKSPSSVCLLTIPAILSPVTATLVSWELGGQFLDTFNVNIGYLLRK